jgi:hypothetical protein
MSISMFGESSNHQCSSTQSSHVSRKLKAQFNAASISSAGSYSMVTSGKCQIVTFISMYAAHSNFSDSGKCYVWGLVPWAAKSFPDPLELDIQECIHVQATNLFAAVITSVSK